MKIRNIKIENFRGIKKLVYNITNDLICFIGPGDSCKTTILDAIEYVLTPSYYVTFYDSDFYNCDTTKNISIEVTVTNLPPDLLSEQKLGLFLRTWSKETGIHDEPDEKTNPCDLAITIKLSVDSNLEPEWTIINDRIEDKREISNRLRARLGVSRLGESIDQHLSWGKNSTLNRITEDFSAINTALLKANRKIRDDIKLNEIDEFKPSIDSIKQSALEFGIKPKESYKPQVDVKSLSFGFGAISLFDGNVPVRNIGTGSKRLLTLGLQVNSVKEGAIMLIDEVEQGLEPFRLRNLLRELQKKTKDGQVFITSHSSITLCELGAVGTTVVRDKKGNIECLAVDEELQGFVRNIPEALLGKTVIVAEGATEYGAILAFEEFWVQNKRDRFSYLGIVPVNGHGSTFQTYAISLKTLGYDVVCFTDSDVPGHAEVSVKLNKIGIKVFSWEDNLSIEERIFADIPFSALDEFLTLAANLKKCPISSIFDAIKARLSITVRESSINDFKTLGKSETEIRKAIGVAANENEWFKKVYSGRELFCLYFKFYESVKNSSSMNTIKSMENYLYA